MNASAPQPFAPDIPFPNDLGIELLDMADGAAQLALTLQPRHMNSWHVTHGGVTMTMLDVVMSMAGRSLYPEAQGAATVEMKVSFMQPAGTPGVRIIATGKVLHRSTTMCFCEAEIRDGDQLVAKAMGTFKYLRRADIGRKMARG